MALGSPLFLIVTIQILSIAIQTAAKDINTSALSIFT